MFQMEYGQMEFSFREQHDMEWESGVKGRLLVLVIILLLLCECESSGPQAKSKQDLNPRKTIR